MPKEILDIVDTAVKIGLGAIISGVATYAITHKNHSHTKKNDLRAKKINILAYATENIEPYFNTFRTCISRVDGALRSGQQPGPITNQPWYEKFLNLDRDFVATRKTKSVAISRLKLAGFENVVDKLLLINELDNQFRQKMVFDTILYTSDELSVFKKEFYSKQDDVYKSLKESFMEVYS